MNAQKNKLYFGGLIILIGVLALLINTNVLHGTDDLLGGALLLLGGLFFFNVYEKRRSAWWPLLPASVLTILGAGLILDTFVPFASDLLGAAFMYAIFAVFAYVFARDRALWWAVLPAGICFTLGTVILIDSLSLLDADLGGAVFLLGTGLTFYYLWSLRHEMKNLNWAIWPAGVLVLLALVTYSKQFYWWRDAFDFPLMLILVGIFVIVIGRRHKKT